MKTHLSLLVIIFTFIFLSCKQETASIDYTYADKPQLIDCKKTDTLLLKEAYYTFENDITNFYDPQNKNVSRAMASFIRIASSNASRIDFNKIATPRTIEIYNTLKADTGLWNGENLNYEHPLFACIGEQIKDQALNRTYNALIDTGSMKASLFGAPLNAKFQQVTSDKYLATFVALQFYYANLANVTPQVKEEQKTQPDNSPVDFNKIPR
ncbi:MAG TPA: hypothetical protein VFF15_08090 [Flavobacteriaceae bacterium]|nr:hypothetical protein [Flavobacteriaceae bacterium]